MKNIILTLVFALSFASFASVSTFAKANKSKFAATNHSSKINSKSQLLIDLLESKFSGVSANASSDLALSESTIWKNSKDAAGKWIYVEQASVQNTAKPFRQKIYNIAQVNDSTFLTAVYNVPQAAAHVGEWKSENALASVSQSDLDFKTGCDVYLVFYKNNQMQLGNSTVKPENNVLTQKIPVVKTSTLNASNNVIVVSSNDDLE